MQTVFAFTLVFVSFLLALPAQVVPIPSGCSPTTSLTCPAGSAPFGVSVDFIVGPVLALGPPVILWIEPTDPPVPNPVAFPFAMGTLFPAMLGCLAYASPAVSVYATAAAPFVVIPVTFPASAIGFAPFFLQAVVFTPAAPQGFELTGNALEYVPN